MPNLKGLPHDCHSHAVHFYADYISMGAHVAAFLAEGLQRGEAVFAVATKETHDAILTRLPIQMQTNGTRPYTAFDADELLSGFLVDGVPHRDHFFIVMNQIFASPAKAGRPIRVYGEMVVRLWQAGKPDAALQLEELWNLLAERYRFSLLCAYPMKIFDGQDARWFLNTCATHSQLSIVSEKGLAKTPCLV